jgi:hypothetical protein
MICKQESKNLKNSAYVENDKNNEEARIVVCPCILYSYRFINMPKKPIKI